MLQSSSDAGSSSRRRRSRKAAAGTAVLAAPQEVVGAEDDPAVARAAAAGDAEASAPLVEGAAQGAGFAPISVSPVDGSEGHRRWSRSSKKVR